MAQQKVITGYVIDALTSQPLAYANIGVLGQSQGSISNDEGYYVLSIADVLPTDTIFFSFIGYDPLKMTVSSVQDSSNVALVKRAVELSDISILSREYTPLEVIDMMKSSFKKNHPSSMIRQQVFRRDASYSTIHKSDVEYKKSSFDAIDQSFVDHFNNNMPEQLNVFFDNLLDMYYGKGERKIVPIQGQTLLENWDFNAEFSKRIDMLAGDIGDGMTSEDNYFKVRSGVFAGKLDLGTDTSFILNEDSLSVSMGTDQLQSDLNYLRRNYSTINSKRFDFITEYSWYDYSLIDVSIINGELAYIISFKPNKRKAKYEGTICIAMDSYALLQIDYAFAEGKEGRAMSLLGVNYGVENRSGRVIFEKRGDAHYLKYLYRESKEHFAIDRSVALKRKKDSGLFDKTLQEVKLDVNFDVTLLQKKEMLVVSQETIDQTTFDNVVQPATYKLQKVHEYSPEMWENSSIIGPSKALRDYKKQY